MKKIITRTLSVLIIVLSFMTCKSGTSSGSSVDIFSADYATSLNKKTAGQGEAKVFVQKALELHKQKQYAPAEIEWKNALKHYADGEMYYGFGNTLFNLNRFQDAIKAYKNAIELNHPQKKYVYYNIACAYSRMENGEGIKYLGLAIQNGYNSYEHIKRDKDLAFFRSKIGNIKSFIDENDMLNRGLFKAIDEENIHKVKELVKKGANVNLVIIYKAKGISASDNYGRLSPLMLASMKGNVKIVEILLDNGADINYSYNPGTAAPVSLSALSTASDYNKIDVIRVLIKRGIDIKKLGGYVIANHYNGSNKIFKLLIEAGADINYSVEGTPLTNAIKDCNINLINYLFEKGANPNAMARGCCASSDISPLMQAIISKCIIAIDILFAKGANINEKNQYGETALIFALYNGNLMLANLLLSKGAEVKNVVFLKHLGGFDESILMLAIKHCPNMVQTLIQKGANINHKNKWNGTTALSLAREKGLTEIVKLLQEAGAKE